MLRYKFFRFARVRVPPPASQNTVPSSSNANDEDELLMMGLRPLAATEEETKPQESSTTSATKTSSSPYSNQSSFNKFFRQAFQQTSTNQQKKKQSKGNLFSDLMNDLKDLKQQEEAQPSQQQNVAENPIVVKTAESNKIDSSFREVLKYSSCRAKPLEHIAPELERLQRNRSFLLRKWTKQDVEEIVRRQPKNHTAGLHLNESSSTSSDPSTKMLDIVEGNISASEARDHVRKLVVEEIDLLAAKAREETAFHFHQAVQRRTEEILEKQNFEEEINNDDDLTDEEAATSALQSAAIELISEMSDAELQAVIKSGAIDIDALWEGEAELAQLPNEYLKHDSALQLTKELSLATQPQLPTDDEAQAMVNVDKNDRQLFTERDVVTLERFERRQAYAYVEQPNSVLKYLAQNEHEEKIRKSLEVMDRAKRSMLRDVEFQAALSYVNRLEQQEIQNANVRPVQRKNAAEVAVPFFDKGHSRPPLKAQTGVGEPKVKDKHHDPKKVAAWRQKQQDRKMFTMRREEKQVGAGENKDMFENWYG